MLIGGGNISRHFPYHVFFGVCLYSRSFPLRADWRKSESSVVREPQGNWTRNSNSREEVASSTSFSHHAARTPRRACLQAMMNKDVRVLSSRDVILSHTMENALNFVLSQYCIKKNPVGKNSDQFFYVPFVSD